MPGLPGTGRPRAKAAARRVAGVACTKIKSNFKGKGTGTRPRTAPGNAARKSKGKGKGGPAAAARQKGKGTGKGKGRGHGRGQEHLNVTWQEMVERLCLLEGIVEDFVERFPGIVEFESDRESGQGSQLNGDPGFELGGSDNSGDEEDADDDSGGRTRLRSIWLPSLNREVVVEEVD